MKKFLLKLWLKQLFKGGQVDQVELRLLPKIFFSKVGPS